MLISVSLFAIMIREAVKPVPVEVSGHDWFSGFFGLTILGIWIYAAAFIVAPRLRDAGFPGILALLALVPCVNVLIGIAAMFLPTGAAMRDSHRN